MAYTKGEALKLTQFWCFVLCIISFIIEGIIAVAQVSHDATIAMFVIAVVFAVISCSIWIYIKVKKTNRKITS
ncbi:MAG: hypothetical protein HDR31_01630 [Mycoplasma sp.]|nr:hypothetical protein [Mycoplasma sp.]